MLHPPSNTLVKSLSIFCLALFFSVFSAQAAKRISPEDVQNLLQRQMNWDENPANGKNPYGLHFQFFKIDESGSPGESLLTYRVYVLGAPEGKKYGLTVWKIGSEPHLIPGDIYVNGKGLLMVHKPNPGQEDSDFVGDDELHLTLQAAQGEPIRYSLASSDKQVLISGTVVPFPLEANGQGCRLEVRLALPDADAVLISADGLPANTDVPLQLISGGVADPAGFHTDARGHGVTTNIPVIDDLDGGSLRVALSSHECSTAIEVPWGKKSYSLR
jgi:hypothetical protein